MQNKYPNLFSPIKIGNVVYKNRIFQAPATPHLLQTDEKYPNEQTIAYYAEKARGGTASVTVAGHNMNPYGPPIPGHYNIDLRDKTYHRYWLKLTDQIHFYGAKASLELLSFFYHGFDSTGNRVTYSVDGTPGPDGSPRPMMDRSTMERIAEDYANVAEQALNCGFDSILIHGGHGLVIFRFLSPLFNKRTDEFGGSFENRARFPMMILDAIRKRVGKRLLIEYRISGSELADLVGFPNADQQFSVEDCVEFLRMAGDRIDIAHVSAGNMSIPGTEAIMHPTIFLQPRNNAYLARKVKELGVPQPVLTLGAFQNPADLEDTLATGGADLIAMARGTIADPQMPNKAFNAQEDEIIPCIKCFHCLDYNRALSFCCSVNPTVGRESQLKDLVMPTEGGKKVVVIGGGPSGMEAAIDAAKRGHDVTLIDRASRLGGKLVFSEQASFKYDLANFLKYQMDLIQKLGIKVQLGVEATPEMVSAMKPDVVLAALGANAVVPPIPGVNSDNVVIAEKAYEMIDQIGDKIVLIGGGEVGCETALHLTEKAKKVTIIEMLPTLCPETFYLNREVLVGKLEEVSVIHCSAKCTGISEKGVSFVDKDGKECLAEADTVVLSAGMRPRSDEAEAFRGCAPIFRAIGDSVIAKNVRTATHSAYDAVMCF